MATNSFLTLSFDQASLAEIAQIYGFQTLLSQSVQTAMGEAGKLVAQAAKDRTWIVFDNPTGALADTISAVAESPYEIQISADSPYAARREYGFSGKTDSLGRYYANDPAKPYMQPALDDNKTAVLLLIDAAVAESWASKGGE